MRRYGPLVFSSLALVGILTGCASPVIMIASQMVGGVSYLATGKSTTDHALSGALDEDCALHRLIEGAAVCKAKPVDPAGDIQTASLAGAPVTLPDGAFERLSEELTEDREGFEDTHLGVRAVVPLNKQASPGTAQKTGQVLDQVAQAADQSVQAVQVSRGFGADMFFVPHHAGDADDRAKTRNLGSDAPAMPSTGNVGPKRDIAAVPDQDSGLEAIATVANSVSHPSAVEPDKRFFIVLGSFSTRGNAQLAADQMPASVTPVLTRHSGPQIAMADVRGRTFYRIVLGPLDQPTTLQARRQFVAAGIGNTWTIAACGRATSTGCIAGY
ncbi:MAG: hypothetical protein ACI82H_001620 [Alphaproteobacteria bacterium]|jgi:hypothetical protein